MTNKQLTVDLKSAECTVTPISASEYRGTFSKTLPIAEDCDHLMALQRQLQRDFPHFDHPRLYAALSCLFGESTTYYDDYKCSFGYLFLLEIKREGKRSRYLMVFTDIKGADSILFRRILDPCEEDRKEYSNRGVLREPMEDDFSRAEMRFLMNWFSSYLIGFMESFEPHYNKEFARSLDCGLLIYGYRNGHFFLDRYDNYDSFRAAKLELSENGSIPFNAVRS